MRGELRLPPQPEIVTADSGIGGFMAGALVPRATSREGDRGPEAQPSRPAVIRHLADGHCLPIGEKPTQQAITFTARMVLWPLIEGLKDEKGEYGKPAEHVIVACNSASVRVDHAIPLIEKLCSRAAADPGAFDYPPSTIEGLRRLHQKISADPNYLKNSIHEIVTPTSKRAAADIVERFKEDDDFFIRIDSTNGTVDSNAYLERIPKFVEEAMSRRGYKMEEVHFAKESLMVNNQKYLITQRVVEFRCDGQPTKRLFLENRGNPPWVRSIEDGSYVDQGPRLVADSEKASRLAADRCGQFGDRFRRAPQRSESCCTHYPVMQPFLQEEYGRNTQFFNQASIVEAIWDGIVKQSGGATSMVSARDAASAQIAVTVGSQNINTVSAKIGASPITSDISRTVDDVKVAEAMLSRVGSEIRAQGGLNDPIKASIQTQDEAGGKQDGFEMLVRHLGRENAINIMTEGGYRADVAYNARGEIARVYSFAPTGERAVWGPQKGPKLDEKQRANIGKMIDEPMQERIGEVAKLVTLGETRGVDRISIHLDVKAHLLAATAQIKSTIEANSSKPISARNRVGILTGFTVIDNASRQPLGGENDGPPGAVTMARTIIEQGTPVTLVTDGFAEPSLLASLEAIGLASPSESRIPIKQRTLQDYKLDPLLEIEIARRAEPAPGETADLAKDTPIVDALRDRLAAKNVTTMISIERPSITNYTIGGKPQMFSMVAKSIAHVNMDMSRLLVSTDKWKPFRIGIGDGGNELGMGVLKDQIANMRWPNMDHVVSKGPVIASAVETDATIVGSVSNNAGVALSMSLLAALGKTDELDGVAERYVGIIDHLFKIDMSLDGVEKKNLMKVDGRAVGTLAEARTNPAELGAADATHSHMFDMMIGALRS